MRTKRLPKLITLIFLLSALLMFTGAIPQCQTSSTTYHDDDNEGEDAGTNYNTTPGGGNQQTEATFNDFGVIVFNLGWLGIIDGPTKTLATPRLLGNLGSFGGGLFDVVISPDKKTTLVSNFGDSVVNFIDTSNPTVPTLITGLNIGFFAEDMDITPDGKYALVTDGGFSTRIAVLDMANHTVHNVFGVPPAICDIDGNAPDCVAFYNNATMHQAVTISPDGKTVLTADYFGGLINVFTLNSAGQLTFVKSINVMDGQDEFGLRPVNVAFSPDGKTAIAAVVGGHSSGQNDYGFPVMTCTGPGQVALTDMIRPPAGVYLQGAQSVVFNYDGTQAYLHCVQVPEWEIYGASWSVIPSSNTAQNFDTLAPPGDDEWPNNVIVTLDITSTGHGSFTKEPIEVIGYGTSQLFGVDTLAMDFGNVTGRGPSYQHLYVSNPTISGASPHMYILDMENNGASLGIRGFDSEYFPPCDTCDDEENIGIPCGVYFTSAGN